MASRKGELMQLTNYWRSASYVRENTLERVQELELEAQAEERGLLVYNGKLIKPEDYPCTCEKQSPYHCFEENKELPDNEWSKADMEVFLKAQEDKMCPCPCHSYCEPD